MTRVTTRSTALPPAPGADRPAAPALRVRAARPADMPRVAELINGYAARGLMLPRPPAQLVRLFREFVVAEDGEGRVVGCGGLRVYTAQLAELVGLAVDERAQGAGVGAALVRHLEAEAREVGVGTVFALTLREGFFHRLGFRTVPREVFPLKVWEDCRGCARREACDEIAVVRELG